jgi:lipopolysaccharide biosynthesis regulator YciM
MGWLVARIDIKQLLLESRALPQSYFRGLNFLLNEQQDKAIEAFIEVTKANPEAVELQFALGSLFRRRGEVDRAIRVHQDLSERADLGAEKRMAALLELAMDYQKAGLLDHAERILVDISARGAGNDAQQRATLKLLKEIYEQERDWRKAIEVAGRLRSGDQPARASRAEEIANFHCELAVQAHRDGEDAMPELDAALLANPKCVRANLLRGEWLAAAGRHGEAIDTWQRIEAQNADYVGLMADQLLASYTALGEPAKGLAALRRMQQQYPALDMLNALFRATLENEGAEAAFRMVKADLRRHPTLVGLDRLFEAQLLTAAGPEKSDLQVLKDLVHAHSSRLAVYLCANCGFKARQFHWQCPACGGWETFPPRLTAEYDTSDRHLVRAQVEQANSSTIATLTPIA